MRAKTMQNKIKYTPTGCFVLNDSSGGLVRPPDESFKTKQPVGVYFILFYCALF